MLFLGVDEESNGKQGGKPPVLPRTYTLTHSDVTASLTLAVSHTINRAQLQGWYNRLQRDEVVAEWKKVRGRMSLHVHCHISGGHFLLDLIAGLRYIIFRKELPVVRYLRVSFLPTCTTQYYYSTGAFLLDFSLVGSPVITNRLVSETPRRYARTARHALRLVVSSLPLCSPMSRD